MAAKEVVLVTGSSGCLGQHIVKLLQERDDNVAEIRLFDLKPYQNNLGHSETKKMTEFIGDIRHPEELLPAMEGVDCVIHTAAITDIRLLADEKEMDSVNVYGTQIVIDCCLQKNVARLIFASSSDMVCGTEHIFYGTESTTPIPKSFMIGKYGESKCRAEELVLKAHGQVCRDGRTPLRAVSIRPTPFFGEQDKHFFIRFMKHTAQTRGVYYRVKSLDERLQITYVGNVAWAFLKAKDRLAVDQHISGEAFFITDDTPIIDIHEHVEPYLQARGFGISKYILPYWLVWICLSILCLGIRLINLVVPTYDSFPFLQDVPSVNQLNYICSTFFYNRSKATLRLDYQPIFTAAEARSLAMPYYKEIPI